MNAIVTGAAGFIGSHVAELLLAGGHRVMALDDLSGGFPDNVPPAAEFERRSINSDLDPLFRSFRPEAVYHLAAYAAEGLSHHVPVFNYLNNVVGTANVLAAAYRAGARHFVFTSSIAVYGHPPDEQPFSEESACQPCDPYGVAKLACEHHIRAFQHYYGAPAFTIFRPHNVFGPRQNVSDPYRNVAGIFISKALRGEPLPVFGDGGQTRSFSYISSVARPIAAAPLTPAAAGRVINIGGDEPLPVLDLARQVIRLAGTGARIEHLAARREVRHAHCTHHAARRIFREAWAEPVDIAGGLARTIDYVRSRAFPPVTPCPSAIEVPDLLPPSWAGIAHACSSA